MFTKGLLAKYRDREQFQFIIFNPFPWSGGVNSDLTYWTEFVVNQKLITLSKLKGSGDL